LVVLFSSKNYDEKFDFIDNNIFLSKFDIWVHCLLLPATTSVAFILLYPVISKVFYGYWLRRQRELKALRDEIEGATLLTKDESLAIRLELIKSETNYKETINRLTDENNVIKKQLSEMLISNQQATEEKKSIDSQTLKLSNAELETKSIEGKNANPNEQLSAMEIGTLKLIEMIAKNNGQMERLIIYRNFNDQFKDAKVRVDYYIDEAKKLKLLLGDSVRREIGSAYVLSLTEEGRRFAVQQKYV